MIIRIHVGRIQQISHTRLNFPFDNDRHLFFAPLCDFNFGNSWTADVENVRVVASSRLKKSILVWKGFEPKNERVGTKLKMVWRKDSRKEMKLYCCPDLVETRIAYRSCHCKRPRIVSLHLPDSPQCRQTQPTHKTMLTGYVRIMHEPMYISQSYHTF